MCGIKPKMMPMMAPSLRLCPCSLCTYALAEPNYEKCHFQGSPGRGKSGILLLLFFKEGGNAVSSQQIMDRPFHMLAIRQGLKCVFPGQQVHLDQAKKVFFPCLHHPEAQKIVVFFHTGITVSVQSSVVTPWRFFFYVCGHSSGTIMQDGDESVILSARPTLAGSLQG